MKYTVTIDYGSTATFADFDDMINFIGYALDGGLKNLTVSTLDEEVSADE